MKDTSGFVEVCIYEVKSGKIEEFERLIRSVGDHHGGIPGTRDVRYMRRTHRPADFASVKKGEPAIQLTRKPQSVTYVLYWELNDEVVHGEATRSGLELFYRDFIRCLVAPPRIILGKRIF